jgi:hypothetical protein
MPTVVKASPRASGGRSSARTSGGPAATIRTAAAHCERARAVVRHELATAASVSTITDSGAAVPPQSAGTNRARMPCSASCRIPPLAQGPMRAVSAADAARSSQAPRSSEGVSWLGGEAGIL